MERASNCTPERCGDLFDGASTPRRLVNIIPPGLVRSILNGLAGALACFEFGPNFTPDSLDSVIKAFNLDGTATRTKCSFSRNASAALRTRRFGVGLIHSSAIITHRPLAELRVLTQHSSRLAASI